MPTLAQGQVVPLSALFDPAQMGGWGTGAMATNGGWAPPQQDPSQPTLAPSPYAPPQAPPSIATQGTEGGFGVDDAIGLAAKGASTLGKWTDTPGLTAAGNAAGGALGLVGGAMAGDPAAAIGGAAKLGGTLANWAGYPEVAQGFGAVGGPLSFATGLASGNPMQAATGAIQTASTISGWMGGPTISSLTAPVTNAIGEFISPVTSAIGNALGFGSSGSASAGAAAAGAGAAEGGFAAGMAASVAPMAAAAPFVMMVMGGLHAAMTGGGDMFDSMFGEDRTQAVKQRDEYQRAQADLGQYLPERKAGAEVFNRLPDITAPEDVLASLKIATQGMWAGERLGPAVIQVNNGEKVAKIKGKDLSGLIGQMPKMEADNVAAFLTLADRAYTMGLNTDPIFTKDAPFGTSDDHTTRMGVAVDGSRYRTAKVDLIGSDHRNYEMGSEGPIWSDFVWEGDWDSNVDQRGRQVSTQEALDLNRAIGSLGIIMGIDPNKLPGGSENALQGKGIGNYLAPDQLAAYGLTPGNYTVGTLNLLRQLEPAVVDTPAWKAYTAKMGVTPEQLAGATAAIGTARTGLGAIEDGFAAGTLSPAMATIKLLDMGYSEEEAAMMGARLSTMARKNAADGGPNGAAAGDGSAPASGEGDGGVGAGGTGTAGDAGAY